MQVGGGMPSPLQSASAAGYVAGDGDVTAEIPIGPTSAWMLSSRCSAVAAVCSASGLVPGGGSSGSGTPTSASITVAYWLTCSPGCGTCGPTSMKHGDVRSMTGWTSNVVIANRLVAVSLDWIA